MVGMTGEESPRCEGKRSRRVGGEETVGMVG